MPPLGLGYILNAAKKVTEAKNELRQYSTANVPQNAAGKRHKERVRECAREVLKVITGSDQSDPDEVESEIKALLTDMGYIKSESGLALQHAESVVRNVGVVFNSISVGGTVQRRNLLQLVVNDYTLGALTQPTAEEGFGFLRLGEDAYDSAVTHVETHGLSLVTKAHLEPHGPPTIQPDKINAAIALIERDCAVMPGSKEGTLALKGTLDSILAAIVDQVGIGKTKAREIFKSLRHIRNHKSITFKCIYCKEIKKSDRRFCRHVKKCTLSMLTDAERGELEGDDPFGITEIILAKPFLPGTEAARDKLRRSRDEFLAATYHWTLRDEQNGAQKRLAKIARLADRETCLIIGDFMSDPTLGTETHPGEVDTVKVGLCGFAVFLPGMKQPVGVDILSSTNGKSAFDAVKALDACVAHIAESYAEQWGRCSALHLLHDQGTHFYSYVYVGSIFSAPFTASLKTVTIHYFERKHGKTEWVDGRFQTVQRWCKEAQKGTNVTTVRQLAEGLNKLHKKRGAEKDILEPEPKRPLRPGAQRLTGPWKEQAPYRALVGETSGPRRDGVFSKAKGFAMQKTLCVKAMREDVKDAFTFYNPGASGEARPEGVGEPLAWHLEEGGEERTEDAAEAEEACVTTKVHTKIAKLRRLKAAIEGSGAVAAHDSYEGTRIAFAGETPFAQRILAGARCKVMNQQGRLLYYRTGAWEKCEFFGVCEDAALKKKHGVEKHACVVVKVYTLLACFRYPVAVSWVQEQFKEKKLYFTEGDDTNENEFYSDAD